MTSPTLNVARYSALVGGVLYGWYHRRSLQQSNNTHKLEHAIHERQRLVAEAKVAWKKQQESHKDTIVTDPDDPRFDLEKLLTKWENA
ncbi:ATP synthase E chain-domain-containing protein [Mycena floridula]|nr:ATP synthase E chain-domain-containing protein [Mycena floridula]